MANFRNEIAHARNDAIRAQLQALFHERPDTDENRKVLLAAETLHQFLEPVRIVFRILDAGQPRVPRTMRKAK